MVRFHLSAGARVALRAAVPAAAVATAAATFHGSGWVRAFARDLAVGRIGAAAVGLAALAAGRVALPRVLDASGGWLRHLPASDRSHRRSAVLAIAAAETPLWLGAMLLGAAAWPDAPAAATRFLAAVPLEILAGASLALAGRVRVEASLLAGAAAILGALPYTGALATGWGLLALADAAGGTLDPPRTRSRSRGASAVRWIDGRIAWRALRSRVAAALVLGLIPLLAGVLFAVNNALVGSLVDGTGRLTGLLAVTLALALLGEQLAQDRPAWLWRRSLPESALVRVASDAAILGILVLPLVAAGLLLFPTAAGAIAGTAPFLAARAAGAIRGAGARKSGASGAILLEGALAALAITLLPRLAWGLLAAAPAALALAARAEQQDKASVFHELHHRGAGDPAEWRDGC